METQWKDIEDYEGFYQVSNNGQVRSLDRILMKKNGRKQRTLGHIMKLHCGGHSRNYLSVMLQKNGSVKRFLVHRLVASAFLIKKNQQDQVNHKDGNKTNNDVSNLEWCSCSYNLKHSKAINKGVKGYGVSKSKKRFITRIQIEKKSYHLGSFKTKQEAQDCYYKTHVEFFGYAPVIIGYKNLHENAI